MDAWRSNFISFYFFAVQDDQKIYHDNLTNHNESDYKVTYELSRTTESPSRKTNINPIIGGKCKYIYMYISETLSLHMLLLSIGYQGITNNRFLIQFLNRDQRSIIRLSVTAVNLSSAFFPVFFSVVISLALVVVFLPILLIVVVRKYRRTGSRQEVNESMEMVAIPNKL